MALVPVVVTRLLRGDAGLYGVMLGCAGFGSVVGAAVSGRLRVRWGPEAAVRGSQVAVAAALLLTAVSRSPWLTGLAQFLAGTGMVLALTSFNVTMQLSVPRWVVGRAMSVYQMATFGGFAIGALLWGGVAEQFGIVPALVAAAVASGLVFLLGFPLPLAEPDPELLRPVERQFRRELPVGEVADRAPVSVIREYVIQPGDRGEFIFLMRERRRLMRRHGARQWSLAQDPDRSDRWIERYQRPELGTISSAAGSC